MCDKKLFDNIKLPAYDERLNMLSCRAACRSRITVWRLYLISVTDRNTSLITAGVWLPVEKVTSVVRKTRTKRKSDDHDSAIFSGNNHRVCYSTEQQLQIPHESTGTSVRWCHMKLSPLLSYRLADTFVSPTQKTSLPSRIWKETLICQGGLFYLHPVVTLKLAQLPYCALFRRSLSCDFVKCHVNISDASNATASRWR